MDPLPRPSKFRTSRLSLRVLGVVLITSFLSPVLVHARTRRPEAKEGRARGANLSIKAQPKKRTDPVFPAGPGPFGLLGVFLSSVTGCVGMKSAGESCYDIDYIPGARDYPDSDFELIQEKCRLDLVISWDIGAGGPDLSAACEEAILALLPLDTSLRTGSVSPGPGIRSNLAKAFHTLLFFPLGNEGSIFGSDSASDYCDSVYQEFLGAAPLEVATASTRALTGAAYDRGYSQMNLHLVRFILERISWMRSISQSDAPGALAQASGNIIEFTPSFEDLNYVFDLAGVLVHESRHVSEGFPDGSDHVGCETGVSTDDQCDDHMFGAYGAQISYIDSVLRGSLGVTLEDGTPILSRLQVQAAVSSACNLYQSSINIPAGELAETFGSDCSSVSDGTDEGIEAFVRNAFGVELGDLSLR